MTAWFLGRFPNCVVANDNKVLYEKISNYYPSQAEFTATK
jgi:hypothetical protein